MAEARRSATPEAPTWESVLKRNSIERLKIDKPPLGIRDELPGLIATGYEDIPEEDIVRLKWWGLYHDKPKIGTFMLRIKLAGGIVSPTQLRAIGQLSLDFSHGESELSTRQNVQLHYLELRSLPEVFARMDAVGLTSAGGCGDTVRNITGCPLTGLAHDELFDATPVLEESARFFYGNVEYANMPRKHKISIGACVHRCWAPEINDISLIGAIRDGRPGFGLALGGGLSSVPRIARDIGVFVTFEQALAVQRALLDAWSEDLKYRASRVKSRMKFMVDDYGPEGMRRVLEERLGYALPDFPLPEAPPVHMHLGIAEQKQPGLYSIGVPVHLGLVSGQQLVELADMAEDIGGDARITRQQNLILTSVPESRVAEVRMNQLVDTLEERFGEAVSSLHLALDGCPHACAHHWIGDLGFQGTTLRDEAGKPQQAYDIYVRGGLGIAPEIGRPLFRRVHTEELDGAVVALVGGWLTGRGDGETFTDFTRRLDDAELGVLVGREPAAKRKERK
jgi:sulfite reductase beta subunit-like hemoprotein